MENYFNFRSQNIITEENTTIWLNISLIPYPPVSAKVCGYITDAQTNTPITDVHVHLDCKTETNDWWYNYTNTNEIGYYSLGTIPGRIDIYAHETNYGSSDSDYYYIDENETIWINLSLEFEPEENAFINGYVIDDETSGIVRNAFIQITWKDELGHFMSKNTFTDQKGFYSITVPNGSIQCLFTGNGYHGQQTSWFNIDKGETAWVNITLSPEINAKITKPLQGIYINNETRFPILNKFIQRFLPRFKPLIIGPITIEVNITESSMGCNRVDFYIDDNIVFTDNQKPYSYNWNTTGLGRHLLQIIAYDNAGPCDIDTIQVRTV